MKDDEYEKLAQAVYEGNRQTIAALQEMSIPDLRLVERAFRLKYKADINFESTPSEIHSTLGQIRARKPV
jgi:hypothetical protein